MTTPKLSRIGVIDFSPEIGSLDRVIPCTIYLLITFGLTVDHSQNLFPFPPTKKKILRTSPIHAHCFGMQMVYTWYISFERVRATDFDYCCSLRFRPIVIRANQRNVETNVWYNIIGRLPESTFNKQNVRH